MDLSISLVTPEYWRARGAKACDDGDPIDAHGLNHEATARVHWIAGHRQRQLELARRQLAEVSPP